MKITTVGIDPAKNVLQGHGVDEPGKTVLNKSGHSGVLASIRSFSLALPALKELPLDPFSATRTYPTWQTSRMA